MTADLGAAGDGTAECIGAVRDMFEFARRHAALSLGALCKAFVTAKRAVR